MDEAKLQSRLYELGDIISEIEYKDWTLTVGIMGNGNYLQWSFEAKDINTGILETQRSRKWYISTFATKSEVVLTALAAAKMAEMHELHECFLYKGKRLVNPHVDVDALITIQQEDARQHLDS